MPLAAGTRLGVFESASETWRRIRLATSGRYTVIAHV